MLKQNEVDLKERLTNIIKEIGYANDVKQLLGNEFKERNLSALRATFAFNQNLDLKTLTDSDEDIRFLFLFTYSLNKAIQQSENNDIKNIKIDVNDYFTEREVNNWSDYREESKRDSIFPIVIEDVTQLSDKIWQTSFSAQLLNKLDADNLLLYNFKTQRNPKITVAGERINIDNQKVAEIKERLIKGEQFPTQIKLNCVNIGERPVYNPKNRTLTLNEGVIINVFDGWHRKTANSLALEVFPDLQHNWSGMITYMSEKQAHDFMSEIDKQKPIKKEFIQQMDYNRPENLVVDAIIDDKLSELAKVMKDDDNYIRLNRALTKKSIVATAIKEVYEEQLKVSTNIRNIARWIVELTDYLMGFYADEFIVNPYKVKETSMINHKNMFYGYIALSGKLYNNRDWKDLLAEKMESIDFNIDNSLWKDLGMFSPKDANKTLRDKLYKLFTEGL